MARSLGQLAGIPVAELKGVTKDDFQQNKAPSHGRDEEPDWSDDYDQTIRLYYLRTA